MYPAYGTTSSFAFMHLLGRIGSGGVAAAVVVPLHTLTQNKWKINNVPGDLRGVSLVAPLIGNALGVLWALASGFAVCGLPRPRQVFA